MNHKNNPWVSLVALLLAALILVLTCTGCTEASAAQNGRFIVEFGGYAEGLNIYVLTDITTGQQYLFVDGVQCGGLTKLEG